MKRKILLIVLSVCIMATSLIGCSSNSSSKKSDDTLNIVTTIFPEYDWVKELTSNTPKNVDITMLLDNGVDLHSYQPTADDIIKISTADMFIYVGGESDGWVKDALKEATNKNMIVINLLDVLGNSVKEEEVVEGMQSEEEEGASTEDEEVEYDEHVWLSLKNTKVLCKEIAKQLAVVDSDNAELYTSNARIYTELLDNLDKNYQSAVDSAKQKTLLFGDRFPFRYLIDDYKLSYYAAFVGCSAETEASFETITFLSNKIDELGLNYVLTIEGAKHDIAQTIINNTKSKTQQILTLNSMQSTTSKDVNDGSTYLSIMTDNLDTIKKALN